MDNVDAYRVRTGEAAESGAVEVGSWLRESGKEVGIAIGRAFSVLQSVGVGGEEFQPALVDLGDALEHPVVRLYEEFGGPKVSAEAFDGPDDATGLQVEGSPGSFVVECGLINEHDGADGAAG